MGPPAEHTKIERYVTEHEPRKLVAERSFVLLSLLFRWHRGVPRLEEYIGSNKLKGKACIVSKLDLRAVQPISPNLLLTRRTLRSEAGGDSGIGRSVAVAFAREGADVTVAYVAEEEEE